MLCPTTRPSKRLWNVLYNKLRCWVPDSSAAGPMQWGLLLKCPRPCSFVFIASLGQLKIDFQTQIAVMQKITISTGSFGSMSHHILELATVCEGQHNFILPAVDFVSRLIRFLVWPPCTSWMHDAVAHDVRLGICHGDVTRGGKKCTAMQENQA